MSKEAMKLALEALEKLMRFESDSWELGSCRVAGQAIKALREALAEQAQQKPFGYIKPGEGDYEKVFSWNRNERNGYTQAVYTTPQPQPEQQEPVRVPVTDSTYNYAKSLAEAIFKQHFASDEHYSSGRIVWGVNDTVIGILTQIDNMVADMVRKPAQQEPVAWMWRCKPYCDWPEWSVSLKRPADSGRDGHKRTEGYEDVPLYTSPQPSKPWVGLTDEDVRQCSRDVVAGGKENSVDRFAYAIEAKLKEKNA